MDYKKEIIEMLEKIDNICWLRSIYIHENIVRITMRRRRMDYKKETVEILQKINDDSLLEFFYRFIARVLRNRGY